MGWFSADETIALNANDGGSTGQTVALGVLATVAVAYVVIRTILKLHRQHTERVAERAARRVADHANI